MEPDQSNRQSTLKRALQQLKKGRFREAGDICRKIIISNPEVAEAYYFLGVIELQLNNIEYQHLEE